MTTALFVSPQWLKEQLTHSPAQIILLEASVLFDGSTNYFPEQVKSAKADYLAGHLPGAYFIDLLALNHHAEQIHFQTLDSQQFKDQLAHIGWTADKQIIIYDRGPEIHMTSAASIWAARLAWQCYMAGLTQVAILEGGLLGWQRAGGSLTQVIPQPQPSTIACVQAQPNLATPQSKVIAASQTGNALIIDALSPAQYQGKVCPFGPEKAGHIPRAINYFFDIFTDNEQLRLYDETHLQQQLPLLPADKTYPIITYCGFGVAAAWIWAVLTHYGYTQVTVYDGSMEEWVLTQATCMN